MPFLSAWLWPALLAGGAALAAWAALAALAALAGMPVSVALSAAAGALVLVYRLDR